jgi:hypothetical protein
MTEQERLAVAFDEKHEGEFGHVITENNAAVLFADGAMRGTTNWDRLGYELHEPPTDPNKLTGLQKQFWTIRLQDLVNEFDQLRKQAERSAKSGSRFKERLEELKALQNRVRSARSHLAHLAVKEKGFTSGDLERCWDTWEKFTQAIREESEVKRRFDNALLGSTAAGRLEKAKAEYDQAKERTRRRMEAWNSFDPPQARSVVSEELDERSRAERENELAAIGEI